jgi:hypothetical protein
MIPSDEGKTACLPFLATTNATATHDINIDTKGSDHLNIYVACGSHNSATQGITEIFLSESDTVTSPSSQTAIPALSSGTATSTSASNTLPTAAVMALGGVVQEIQVDLRKRKRYVGAVVKSAAVAAGMPVVAIVRATRNEQSADSATEKDLEDGTATNISGCMAVVSG